MISSINIKCNVPYQLTKDWCFGTRLAAAKGTVFKITKIGSSWDNQTIIKLIKGNIKLTVHSSFFGNIVKNEVNGGGDYIPIKDLEKKLGIKDINLLNIGFDPYNIIEYPFIEFKGDIAEVKEDILEFY